MKCVFKILTFQAFSLLFCMNLFSLVPEKYIVAAEVTDIEKLRREGVNLSSYTANTFEGNATISIEFCTLPKPRKSIWRKHPDNLDNFGEDERFLVPFPALVATGDKDCYLACFHVLGVLPADARAYSLQLDRGGLATEVEVRLVVLLVIDTLPSLLLAALVLGFVLLVWILPSFSYWVGVKQVK